MNIDPRTGKLLRFIKLPTDQVTSVAFGGPSLDILYVTSGNIPTDKIIGKEHEQNPHGGCVYSIKGLGVKGYPANNFVPLPKN